MNQAAGQNGAAFAFVPVDGSSIKDAASKKRVRVHAARNSQARRQRVIAYQATQTRNAGKPTGDKKAKACRGAETATQDEIEAKQDGAKTLVIVGSRTGRLPRPDPVTPLGAARTDPFRTFARPMSTFESFLLDHFINYVISNALTCLPFEPAAELEFRYGMMTHWIQMAATDIGMLASVFLAACRNLETQHHPEMYGRLSLKYKSECMHMLNRALASEGHSVSDMTITKTLALASDASTSNDFDASSKHFRAVQEMVRLRGGPDIFTTKGFLGKLVIWFIKDPIQGQNAILEPFCLGIQALAV